MSHFFSLQNDELLAALCAHDTHAFAVEVFQAIKMQSLRPTLLNTQKMQNNRDSLPVRQRHFFHRELPIEFPFFNSNLLYGNARAQVNSGDFHL